MIKNTKVNLTLIFCINKKNNILDDCLDAIARQIDKNFNLIFIFNNCSQSEKDIFNKYKFVGFNKIDYVFTSENISDSYLNEYLIKNNIQTKYEYYINSSVLLATDFVSTINSFLNEHNAVDIISFFASPNIYFKEKYIKVESLSDDFCNQPLIFFDNKVISVEYLKKNNIHDSLFKYYPSLFYVKLIKYSPNWYLLGRQMCKFDYITNSKNNIIDLFDQCEKIKDLINDVYYQNHYSELEYVCIITLMIVFLYSFYINNKWNLLNQKRIITKVELFLKTNFPNWKKNEWLSSKKNKNDKSYIRYLKHFKPRLFYVLKAFKTKLQINGYGTYKK